MRWGSLSPAEKVFVGCPVGREGTPFTRPSRRRPRGLVPQFTGRRRRPPDPAATKGAAVGWRRPKSRGAEVPGFSQHRSHPRPRYSQKLEAGDFRVVPSLERFSRCRPHRSLVCPRAKGSISYLPLITKRYGILVFFFFFLLEDSKNERLLFG